MEQLKKKIVSQLERSAPETLELATHRFVSFTGGEPLLQVEALRHKEFPHHPPAFPGRDVACLPP